MPRRQRVHLDDVPLHIVQPETGGQLHAYALITNHVHLLVTPHRAATVPTLIISLGRRYVQYINTSYRRTGTLWDSRYKSSLIQAETYLLTCMLLYRTQRRSGDDGGGSGASSLDKLSSQRPRTNVAAVSPSLGLPFPLVRPTKHGKPPTVTYYGIISTKKWSANCDWRSTKTSPSGTSVSMRRLSACLGSVARRDREGGRA